MKPLWKNNYSVILGKIISIRSTTARSQILHVDTSLLETWVHEHLYKYCNLCFHGFWTFCGYHVYLLLSKKKSLSNLQNYFSYLFWYLLQWHLWYMWFTSVLIRKEELIIQLPQGSCEILSLVKQDLESMGKVALGIIKNSCLRENLNQNSFPKAFPFISHFGQFSWLVPNQRLFSSRNC